MGTERKTFWQRLGELASSRKTNSRKIQKECKVADEILKYRVTHLIADNMGVAAQKRLVQTNIQVFRYSGNVKDAIDNFLKKHVELTKKSRVF